MAAVEIALLFVLTSICSAFDYKPVYFPGPCPEMPKPEHFNENSLLDFWYSTNTMPNPSFDGYKCITNNITKIPAGIQEHIKFHNATGYEETVVFHTSATDTSGIYDVAMTSENGTISHWKQGFYFHDESEDAQKGDEMHVMAWACADDPERNRHTECVCILSKSKTTPSSTVESYTQYLKKHGSSTELLREVDNDNC